MTETTQDAAQKKAEEVEPEFVVLQDYHPVTDSLDWRVSQTYWNLRGVQAFTTQEVPNLINNNGVSAHKAADVFFTSCLLAEEMGELEREIEVVEIAVGLGLHARFFLDRLRDRCAAEGKDFYNRIVFYATDLSRNTIDGLLYQETLTPHAPRVRYGSINALEPSQFTDHKTGEKNDLTGRVRCILHNYLLDVLPFDLLWRSGDWWGELWVQTRLDTSELPMQFDQAAIRGLSQRANEDDIVELAKVASYFRVHRSFYPIDIMAKPLGREITLFADRILQPIVDGEVKPGADIRVTNSRGAIWALNAMLDTIRDDGFVLFADYGPGEPRAVLGAASYQMFGGGGGMGVNFPLIDHYMQELRSQKAFISSPPGDEAAMIHLRCLSKNENPGLHSTFQVVFDRESYNTLDASVKEAREAHAAQKLQEAQTLYYKLLENHPEHWVLRQEIAQFEHYTIKNPAQAHQLVLSALQLNPTGSAELWCEYGDLIYEGNKLAAHRTYLTAIAINPESPRAQFNLAWTNNDLGRFEESLECCAKALSCDLDDVYRERILALQTRILDHRKKLRASEKERRKNRFMAK